MTRDARVFAQDAQRRWSEAPAPKGWRTLTSSPAVAQARLSLRARPDQAAAQVTEALPGESLEVLAHEGDWAWVRTPTDRYLGWTRTTGLWTSPECQSWQPDLRVTAVRAHAYAGPAVNAPIVAELCWGTCLQRAEGESVTEQHRCWWPVRLPGGGGAWVQSVVCAPRPVADAAEFALGLLGTPYVWGGRSGWGLDCSGLTQLAYAALGRALPRDADQQEAALRAVERPQRGDLAFFPGHVGLMLDERRMVHANATAMAVTVDTLGEGEYPSRLLASLRGYGRWRE